MNNDHKQDVDAPLSLVEQSGETDTGTPNRLTSASKIMGDLVIDGHLDHRGDLEGDITSSTVSNIFIGGKVKGNVRTKGDVSIAGELISGSIYSEGDVTISGKFKGGGLVSAKGIVTVSGEFHGKMEASSIAIEDGGQCSGEFIYTDRINVAGTGTVDGKMVKAHKPTEKGHGGAEVVAKIAPKKKNPVDDRDW